MINLHYFKKNTGKIKNRQMIVCYTLNIYQIQSYNMKTLSAIIILNMIFISQASLQTRLPFFQYCHYHSYPVEQHIIPTDDHYNLKFFRIQAKNTQITGGKRVIYLQHGLFDSSDTWIVNNQTLAPAFHLANKGFDVWLGNSRGNTYSTKQMSPAVTQYWDFTFHQMGIYDLPAAFKYIARTTSKKIHYIGHSQGTLIMFIALSRQLKDVTDNILSFHAFGPVAYMTHQSCKIFKTISKTSIPEFLESLHIKKLLFLNKSTKLSLSQICKVAPITCKASLHSISEMNNTVNNLERMPVILGHYPGGSSTKNFVHFKQFVKVEIFREFDYGSKKNMIKYGQTTPPLYDLTKINLPVHLYVGKYDRLADLKDNQKLFASLNNSKNKTITLYDFGHATFIWGKTLKHVEDAIMRINAVEPKRNVKED